MGRRHEGGWRDAVARAWIRVTALRLPGRVRAGWTEEWLAEVDHLVSEGGDPLELVWGAAADAGEVRRIERRREERTTMTETIGSWFRELKQAARALLGVPTFTAVAVLTLAVGMGGATAIFTLLQRSVLEPLPYPESDRLVRLLNEVPGMEEGAEWNWASAQYFFYPEQARTLEAVGAMRLGGGNIETPDGVTRATYGRVDASAMELLGARPSLGRSIDPAVDRPGGPDVMVLSDGFWRRAFGADPGIVGRTLTMDGTGYEVIGVLEPGLVLPQDPGAPAGLVPDVWLPFRLDPAGPFYNSHVIPMIGRLAPGATPEEATAELRALLPRLVDAYPNVYSRDFLDRYGFRPVVYDLRDHVVGDLAESLWILLGAVALVLVIAAANVANLFLVRIEDRRRELAVRSALGAGRGGILRYLLSETLVLAAAGGVLAVVVAYWAVPALASLAPDTLPRIHRIRLDGSAALFAFGTAAVVALFLALLPTLRLGGGTAEELAGGGRSASSGPRRQLLRSGLVVGQVALALTLVVGAGLLLQSLRQLWAVDPGMEAEDALTATVYLSGERYSDAGSRWLFFQDFLSEVRALPDVEAAGFGSLVPLGGYGCTVQAFADPAVYERLSDSELTTCAGQGVVTPGYFEALGIPLVAGRTFVDADNDDPTRRSVVVSEAFADRFWPGEDPVGKRIGPNGNADLLFTVVGVVGDVKAQGLDGPDAIAVYYPAVAPPERGGWWFTPGMLFVRTRAGDPTGVVPALNRTLAEIDPTIPMADVETMEAVVARSASRLSFTSLLLQIAAGMALVLAAVGLYGVIAYVVSRRTREIGMRLAIGAQRGDVLGLVLRQALLLAAVGIGAGVALSLAGTRFLEGMLYGVSPTHPLAFAAAVAVLAVVTVGAALTPAWRATRVDPAEALRAE